MRIKDLKKRKSVIKYILFTIVLMFCCTYVFITVKSQHYFMNVTFLNVGQGECTIIECQDKYFMIDCGTKNSADSILQFIDKNKINEIEAVFFSHPHSDHIGGAAEIFNKIKVKKLYVTDRCFDVISNSDEYNDLSKIIENSISVESVEDNNMFLFGDAQFTMMSPIIQNDEENDLSVVISLKFMESKFLFTGDISEQYERLLLENNYDIKADVLKIPHHGSNSSSAAGFIKAVSPEIAVISCGKNNPYDHPYAQIVNNLFADNIKIYRTDDIGNITIGTDGASVFRKGK